MKKLMRTFALMAAAALGLSACTGEKLVPDNGNADGKFVTVHFGAEAAIEGATKATLTPEDEKTFNSAWETTDVISVKYLSPNGTEKIVPATWKGEFFEAVDLPNEHGEWYYQACYPKPDETDNHIDFGGARIQDGNKYNSAYDVMICELFSEANADAGKTADGKDVVFNMDRKTGIAYFHLTGGPADEKVESATLRIEGEGTEVAIASQHAYISDFAFAPTKDLKEITITYKEGTAPMASDFQLWYNVLPTTYTKMTLTVETTGHTMTISRTAADNYAAGKLYKVVKDIPADKWVKKVTNNNFVLHEGELVEGDYLIVYEGKAMKATVTSGRLGYAEVTVNGTRIENSDESIIWHIAPSAEYWTIFNDNTTSFAASTGAKNKAQLLTDGTNDMSLWTVTKTTDASTFEFVNKANSSANPAVNANLRNNGTYGFACYATSTGGALSLYRLDGPVDNTIPSLSVDQTSKVWAADATDAFVVKVNVNSEGGDWTVTPETLSWATIAVDKTAGTITVTPNGANETETANEATLTVAHVSDASLKAEITLKQNAAAVTANDGSLERPYTAAEAIAAIDANTDLKGKYVKGIVKEVVSHNSSCGSMVYNIESGEKILKIFNGYDFGHTKFLGTEDLKVGDEVVVFGDLYKHNNTVYELNTDNYLISINGETQIYRGLAVSGQKTAFTVGDAFEFGGKALQVWRGKEDVDVTATATFSGYNMSTEGKQTVTVAVGEETVTYEITVNPAGTVLEKSDPITLANGKFVAGENPTITWSGTSCSFVQTKGQSTTPPNNSYISGPRWYKSHVISFKANTGYKITKVVVTCTSNSYATALKNSTYSPAGTTSATASGAEVTITTAGDFTITMGAKAFIKSVVVYYIN